MTIRMNACQTVAAVLTAILLSSPAPARAQQAPAAAGSTEELVKKLANPISDLVSVPFQFNWEQNVGPNEATRFILNVQPVMPFSLNQDWNLIARVIVPFVSQPPLVDGGEAAAGVGDVLASFFFSPSKAGLTWGVGPAISLPSTAIPTLGTEKWSASRLANMAAPITMKSALRMLFPATTRERSLGSERCWMSVYNGTVKKPPNMAMPNRSPKMR